MGEIEYLTPKFKDKTNICVRPCPHKVRVRTDVLTFGGDIIRVGSSMCLSCEFCVNKRHELCDGHILCNYEAEMKKRKEERNED